MAGLVFRCCARSHPSGTIVAGLPFQSRSSEGRRAGLLCGGVMNSEASEERHHTLLANAVSLAGDWVASVACVAPSSTVAFTLALLLLFAGLASPLAVVVAGVGMLLVAVGFSR